MTYAPDPRPNWREYFFKGAAWASLRADCTRRKVGAVIVDHDNRVVITGYNGAPAGQPGCLTAGACPRGRHYRVPAFEGDDSPGVCFNCEVEWPCPEAAAPMSSYDTGPGSCIAIHAEANALLHARVSVKFCTMYVTEQPCDGCLRLCQGAGLAKVVWPGGVIACT